MRMISLKLPEGIASQLEEESRGRSVSKSRLVRDALEEYLSRRAAPKRRTVLEAAGDLIGCIKEGPEDLATNPDHMRGFGK
jgi:Arc/MetJ-type ribon-helix-helix transcriptional regulator